jgi:hypothetical protein
LLATPAAMCRWLAYEPLPPSTVEQASDVALTLLSEAAFFGRAAFGVQACRAGGRAGRATPTPPVRRLQRPSAAKTGGVARKTARSTSCRRRKVEHAARLAVPAAAPAEQHTRHLYGGINAIRPARLRAPPQAVAAKWSMPPGLAHRQPCAGGWLVPVPHRRRGAGCFRGVDILVWNCRNSRKLLRSFPPLPPPLEIAARFPHSHSFDYGDLQTHPTQDRKEPGGHSTLILQAHPSMRKCCFGRAGTADHDPCGFLAAGRSRNLAQGQGSVAWV